MTSAQPGRAKVPDVTRLPRINGQLLDLRISKCDYPISGAVAKSSRKTTALRGRRLVARAPRCLSLLLPCGHFFHRFCGMAAATRTTSGAAGEVLVGQVTFSKHVPTIFFSVALDTLRRPAYNRSSSLRG